MPKNSKLKPTTFPMEIKFDKEPTTEFCNNLTEIKATLVQYPSTSELLSYIPDFATATWQDKAIHSDDLTQKEKYKLLYLLFKGKIYPGTMETIRLNFCLENISYQDLTHILRYRTATFSVECSGDKFWNDKACTVPTSIQNSPELYERYKKLVLETKKLYCDMLNTRKISLLDARYILVRGMQTYTWMSISLKDLINLIHQRIDKQIQPDSDNILAYKLIQELVKVYPLLAFCFDLHKPSMFYVNTARTGKCTNLFVPDVDNDIYEWNENDYLYGDIRENINGTDEMLAKNNNPFKAILKETDAMLEYTRNTRIKHLGEDFFKEDL